MHWLNWVGVAALATYYIAGPGVALGGPAWALGAVWAYFVTASFQTAGWKERLNPGTLEANTVWSVAFGLAVIVGILVWGVFTTSGLDLIWFAGTVSLSAHLMMEGLIHLFLHVINPLYAPEVQRMTQRPPAPPRESSVAKSEAPTREALLEVLEAQRRAAEAAALDTAAAFIQTYGLQNERLYLWTLEHDARQAILSTTSPQTRGWYKEQKAELLSKCMDDLLAAHVSRIHEEYGGLLDVQAEFSNAGAKVTLRLHVKSIQQDADADALSAEILKAHAN